MYVKQQRASSGVGELLWLIVLCSITAFTAMLVRSGPEAYKSLIIEAIIVPVVVYVGAILFTRYSTQLMRKIKGKSFSK